MFDHLKRAYNQALFQYLLDDSEINAQRLAAASLTLHLYKNRSRYEALSDHELMKVIRGYRKAHPAVRP